MTQRYNQTSRQYEEQLPDGTWQPMSSAAAAGQMLQTPATGAPRNPQAEPRGFGALSTQPERPETNGFGLAQNPDPRSHPSYPGPAAFAVPPEQATPPGSTVGASAGRHGATYQPPAPLNVEATMLPEDAALIETMQGLLANTGQGNAMPPVPNLPTPPPVQVNPGFQVLADHANQRSSQVEQMIAQMRGEGEARLGRAQNKWMILGRWLSDWSATGDASQAGAAMSRVLGANEDMRQELQRETLILTQMGWDAQDAVAQAQANLLAGQTAAAQATADRGYERDVRQTDIESRHAIAGAESAARTTSAQADLTARIAEITHGATTRAREGRQRGLAALTEIPEYSRSAWEGLAPDSIQDPQARASVGSHMAQQQQAAGLLAYIATNQGTNNRQALQFLRQWDPSLTERDLNNTPPPALMMRLRSAPGAAQAFARNPNISEWARFNAAPE